MRVMLAVAEMSVGGAERTIVGLAGELAVRGHSVAVAASPGALDSELGSLEVERYPLDVAARSVLRTGAVVAPFARLIRRWRPDVVHAHNVRVGALAGLAVRLARRRARPPVLTTFHGVAANDRTTAARLLRLSDAVVCVSPDLADALAAAGHRGPIAVVANAIATPAPLSVKRRGVLRAELGAADGMLFSAVGRMVPQKRQAWFLDAAALVLARRPRTRFALVGDGVLRAELEAHAQQLGIAEAVRFTGMRLDGWDLIAASDALVFSSESEGLSIAALEALAAGVPVVTTRVEGMTSLLADGAGVVVDGDPAALAAALVALVDDPGRITEMGSIGRRVVRSRHSPTVMAEAYLRRYEEVLVGRVGAPPRA